MKVLLDSSVLVAAMVEAHPDHGRSLPWLQRAGRGELELVVAAHSLAETYAVLTQLPLRPRISPALAGALIARNVIGHARVVALTARDYTAVIARLASTGVAGGTTYDALIARAAEKAKCDRLLTWNRDHFLRCWPDGAERIATP